VDSEKLIFLMMDFIFHLNMDNVWYNAQQMQIYYDFIAKIRVCLDMIDVNNKFAQNGFVAWPTPNPFYYRTMDSIYLEITNNHVYILWTPFGEVKLLGSGCSKDLQDVSDEFLNNLKKICDLDDVSGKLTEYYWIDSDTMKERNVGQRSGKIYRLVWNNEISPSFKVYSHICIDSEKYTKNKELFELVSHGKNTF
jgi:hypothetical protein